MPTHTDTVRCGLVIRLFISYAELGCIVASDEELLRGWRSGDQRAGSELFKRHFEAVRRFVVNKVDDEVEDIVQRTFMACAENKDNF